MDTICTTQVWPFVWWVAIAIDHFPRRAVGFAVFRKQPTSVQGRTFLGRLYARAKAKYIVCDKGKQFWCDGFKAWCKRRGTKPRFGAVGNHGSTAVLERFIRTLKEECTRRITVPLRRDRIREELVCHLAWYNQHRPDECLQGRTPNEVYYDRPAANLALRAAPRAAWPMAVSCASPHAPICGGPGQVLRLVADYHGGWKHLPVTKLAAA